MLLPDILSKGRIDGFCDEAQMNDWLNDGMKQRKHERKQKNESVARLCTGP